MARISAVVVVDSLSRDQLDALVLQVRRERAVRLRELGLGTLGRVAQAELLDALGRAGLEHTGLAVRVPLREQVRAIVAQAGEPGISESALSQAVRGARNVAELRLATNELVRDGELALVADGGAPRFSPHGGHVLADAELEQLAALAQRLVALTHATKMSAGKPRATLLRSTLEPTFCALRELLRPPALSQREPSRIEGALREAFLSAPAPSGLVRVPEVIRALERAYPRAELVLATTALARAGLLELRPDASIGRLSEDERARCPVALDGTALSYARLTTDAHHPLPGAAT